MAYNTTVSLDKLTCTDCVDFGKRQDRFGKISGSEHYSSYLDVNFKNFNKDDNKELWLVQSLTMGEADFNQFMRLRNQLVIAVENFAKEEHLSSVQISTMPKDMDEQLKLAHKVVDVVDRANRKTSVTPVLYNANDLESSYALVWLFARKKEDENVQQIADVK